jgi:hypothetical protein
MSIGFKTRLIGPGATRPAADNGAGAGSNPTGRFSGQPGAEHLKGAEVVEILRGGSN